MSAYRKRLQDGSTLAVQQTEFILQYANMPRSIIYGAYYGKMEHADWNASTVNVPGHMHVLVDKWAALKEEARAVSFQMKLKDRGS